MLASLCRYCRCDMSVRVRVGFLESAAQGSAGTQGLNRQQAQTFPNEENTGDHTRVFILSGLPRRVQDLLSSNLKLASRDSHLRTAFQPRSSRLLFSFGEHA